MGGAEQGLSETLAKMEDKYRLAVEQAHRSGFREGEAAARMQASAEVRMLSEKLGRSIEQLAELRPRLRREAEGDMLRLALAVARRILRRELAVDPEALHGLAIAALEKLGSHEICRVRVHPSMVSEIRAVLEKSPGRAALQVVADAAGPPGTLVFETERGDLDASVETQLEEIGRGLADRLSKA
jgi:flagellar assembly protein FliH